ncbi:MAG: prolipoprotein diacylglyceryl transferase [Thermodesulfobacteriota bacterium]|nr:prolipoprotein diacylglyceryl transferase [Thermodesulfobacteriota bacterium]
MHPVLIDFGRFKIYSYGVFICIGFFIGLFLAQKEAKRCNLSPDSISDLASYLLIGAIIGSRLLYVIDNWRYYSENPLEIFMIWQGGLIFFGGLILDIFICFLYLWRHKLPFWETLDTISPSVAIGQGFGRIGCLFAGCCYGKPTDVPWAIAFNNPLSLAPQGVSLHPTQLYSSFSNFMIFFFLFFLQRKEKRFPGQIACSYIILSCLFRFFIENLRGDKRVYIIPDILSEAQLISLIFIAVFLSVMFYLRKRSISYIE